MAVNVQLPTAAVNSTNLIAIFNNRQLIAAIARQLVASQVEGHIEMMEEFPAEHPNYASVRGCIKGAKDGMEDVINDYLAEFRENLLGAIEDVQIEVANATFNAAGFVDATAEITSKP